jgi:hypothetical protein
LIPDAQELMMFDPMGVSATKSWKSPAHPPWCRDGTTAARSTARAISLTGKIAHFELGCLVGEGLKPPRVSASPTTRKHIMRCRAPCKRNV